MENTDMPEEELFTVSKSEIVDILGDVSIAMHSCIDANAIESLVDAIRKIRKITKEKK